MKKEKEKEEKENCDEKFTALSSGKVRPILFNISCHFFGTILRVVKIMQVRKKKQKQKKK